MSDATPRDDRTQAEIAQGRLLDRLRTQFTGLCGDKASRHEPGPPDADAVDAEPRNSA
jgi:hypothetical protein